MGKIRATATAAAWSITQHGEVELAAGHVLRGLAGAAGDLLYYFIYVDKPNVQLTISTELQFKLFQFLVPFSQSLNGRLQAESEVLLRDNSFELLGEGNILETSIALKGFPQPIENINTPLEFSKSKIILSDLTAQVGSSELSGSGQIDIRLKMFSPKLSKRCMLELQSAYQRCLLPVLLLK